jgi:hypothetical protein
MKNCLSVVVCAACLVFVLVTAGCMAPPNVTSYPGPADMPTTTPDTTPASTVKIWNLMTEATPFPVPTTQPLRARTFPEPTTPPEDMVCLIDFSSYSWNFSYNIVAKRFDLKNPPMYINYTITDPFNATGTHIVTSKGGVEEIVPYSYRNPYSYLEITVRDSNIGTIYAQDGYGVKYGDVLNKTIKVWQPGNLLVEITGKNVTPSIGFWVKPSGNFNTKIDFSTTECRSQDYVMRLNR